jgi:hypothetical protein
MLSQNHCGLSIRNPPPHLYNRQHRPGYLRHYKLEEEAEEEVDSGMEPDPTPAAVLEFLADVSF